MPFDLRNAQPLNRRPMPSEKPRHNSSNTVESDDHFEHAKESKVGKILHSWRAPEYEVYEKSSRWYLVAGIFTLLMVTYALYNNGPIMAITFILIGIVGYIHLQKDPRVITFSITSKGVIADKEMYAFENMRSFWIFYDPPHTKTISLHTKASMLPFIHIPLKDEDPVQIRELLIQEVPEIKQDPSLVDAIERVLHI